jgi:hypothetical protein
MSATGVGVAGYHRRSLWICHRVAARSPRTRLLITQDMTADFLSRIKWSSVLATAPKALLYAKRIFISRSYDELKLLPPDLIRAAFITYPQAGAQIITTFGWPGRKRTGLYLLIEVYPRRLRVARKMGETGGLISSV